MTVLTNRDAALPLAAGLRVYVERVSPEALARHGMTLVERPEEADVALVRLAAPFEPRDDLFLEAWFHQGSLDFPPGLVRPPGEASPRRARSSSTSCSTGRPSSLPCSSRRRRLGSFGSSDDAVLDALTGGIAPRGRLPFDLPRSMEQVRHHHEDVPGLDDPLLPFGHGLSI